MALCGRHIYIFANNPPQFAKWQLPPSNTVLEIRIRWMGRYLCSLPFSCIFQAWGNFCAAIFFKISQMRSLRRPCFFAPAVSDRIKDLGNVITSCDTHSTALRQQIELWGWLAGCATKRATKTSHFDIWSLSHWTKLPSYNCLFLGLPKEALKMVRLATCACALATELRKSILCGW